MIEFQSAPGLTVGRCLSCTNDYRRFRSFNPRPASRSGDAVTSLRLLRIDSSFNPRPASRSGDAYLSDRYRAYESVSIRARPHGRAMRPHKTRRPSRLMFQSAPGLTVGRCMSSTRPGATPRCFNPRPASRSGDAATQPPAQPALAVSIRARPHGRAMPGANSQNRTHHRFQSAPGLTVGRCVNAVAPKNRIGTFQSAPGLTVGRCWRHHDSRHVYVCFNPRPASRSGDASMLTGSVLDLLFQSAPGLTVGRCNWPLSDPGLRK